MTEYLYEERGLVGEAEDLARGLVVERARWRGNPVMMARLDKAVEQAERRTQRRLRQWRVDMDAWWVAEERDRRALDAIAAEEETF